MHLQYGRRDSVIDDKLEAEVIDIFKEAEVRVNRKIHNKIQAVDRLKNKNITIVKMVNRKYSEVFTVICFYNNKIPLHFAFLQPFFLTN